MMESKDVIETAAPELDARQAEKRGLPVICAFVGIGAPDPRPGVASRPARRRPPGLKDVKK
jgi:hypothetical protein